MAHFSLLSTVDDLILPPDNFIELPIVHQAIASKWTDFFSIGHYMTNGFKHKVFGSLSSTKPNRHLTSIFY